jgi:hypothetical protein
MCSTSIRYADLFLSGPRYFLRLMLGCWLAAVWLPDAEAATLPAPTALAQVVFGGVGTTSTAFPASAVFSINSPNATGCAIAAGGGLTSACGVSANVASPVVAAVVQQTDPSGPLYEGVVEAELGYDVEITGPTASNVPLIVGGYLAAFLSTSFNPSQSGNSNAYLIVYDLTQAAYLLDVAECVEINNSGCGDSASNSITLDTTVHVDSGDLLSVGLGAYAALQNSLLVGAFVDPFFEIDPSFPSADEYSISLSLGIGNPVPTGVPEPPSVSLIGAALIALCGLKKRKAAI